MHFVFAKLCAYFAIFVVLIVLTAKRQSTRKGPQRIECALFFQYDLLGIPSVSPEEV
jgi:hypothetical protein